MNIKTFKTMDGYNVIAEVVEQQSTYLLVNYPFAIIDNPDGSERQYIVKWMKYNSDAPVKIFIHALLAMADTSESAKAQYINLVESYKEYIKENEDPADSDVEELDTTGMTEDEIKETLYGKVLQFIKKPVDGKMN